MTCDCFENDYKINWSSIWKKYSLESSQLFVQCIVDNEEGLASAVWNELWQVNKISLNQCMNIMMNTSFTEKIL